ncbi:hypothetical protein CPB84DRAFT_1772778 [Gymnopilus junonius]|uniref:Uncharacterized protein n=1 Tax=Gymnopilus junonius TaxID=109634 RepID=A0A9P5TQG9_GYMJU|nr:hypothetical protein CPB84DRAFT_1772778 [Gymnopilus junonius]
MSNPFSDQSVTASLNHHHVHRQDEPLPGAKGGDPTVDYSPDTMEHVKLPITEEGNTQDLTPHHPHLHHPHPHHHDPATQAPVGASLGGDTRAQGDEHLSGSTPKPSIGDKVIGKTQELTGKVLHKDQLQEKGELRQKGEKI